MGRKNKEPSTGEAPALEKPNSPVPSSSSSASARNMAKVPNTPETSPSSAALVICRNKHWRYISSFHGPWLQLPVEVLETLANANYYMPLPRPVDPAVFYDLVKIRQLVDGATDLAVRAANGVASSALSNSLTGGGGHHMQALGLGFGSSGGAKLSPERRFRMREQATQKLSRAYHLDEIASSVATMQSTSTLENVAGLVLQRAPQDPDANYVHFFHEKIPSRQLAECTDFRALDLIISQRPSEPEPLRTRAIVRTFKDDYEGAAQDLSSALRVYRLSRPMHRPSEDAMLLDRRSWRRRDNPPVDERDQPESTEVQLLFQRAACYLTLACDNVESALPEFTNSPDGNVEDGTNGSTNGNSNYDEGPSGKKIPTEKQLESRRIVRLYAKRALRDYLDYLKHFHYSANLPVDVSDDFSRQVNQATYRNKRYHNQFRGSTQDPGSPTNSAVGHIVYALADLFSATPPSDLPSYPSQELIHVKSPSTDTLETTTEAVTYHPLLTDALHSLLLCHTLVQTSAKELQRHAHMVARLARLADGYPIFQASRSPSRADWIEVIRRADNWIELSSSWEVLCAPAPLPTPAGTNGVSSVTAKVNSMAITSGSSPTETEDQRKERMRHQAIIEALEDERVNDEASFKAAILARQKRAEADHAAIANGGSSSPNAIPKRWAPDDGREYPILTDRAEAIARWIQEAPTTSGTGGSKRKKKSGSAKKTNVDKREVSAREQAPELVAPPA